MIGTKINSLICVSLSEKKQNDGTRFWNWMCSCGKAVTNTARYLRRLKGCGNGCPISSQSRSAALLGVVRKLFSEKGSAGLNALYAGYKRRARKTGVSFDLTKEQFKEMTSKNCGYCGDPPSRVYINSKKRSKRSADHGGYVYNSLDQTVPKMGYIMSNITPSCKTCNTMKWEMSVEEFKVHIVKLKNNLGL